MSRDDHTGRAIPTVAIRRAAARPPCSGASLPPGHQAAGEAALCAVYPDARNPFAHPELLAEGRDAHTVPEGWVYSSNDRADHYVDITDTFDRKIAALRAHASQTLHLTDLEERMRGWGSLQARAAGLAEGRLAEGYLVLDTR